MIQLLNCLSVSYWYLEDDTTKRSNVPLGIFALKKEIMNLDSYNEERNVNHLRNDILVITQMISESIRIRDIF